MKHIYEPSDGIRGKCKVCGKKAEDEQHIRLEGQMEE
jgi:hypothetical protein